MFLLFGAILFILFKSITEPLKFICKGLIAATVPDQAAILGSLTLFALDDGTVMQQQQQQQLVKRWFETWQRGDFHHLPLTDDFTHTSPFGVVEGKDQYLALVESNRSKFLGYRFILHHQLYGEDKACVCYTAEQGTFRLDVSEWYFFQHNLIAAVVAYYHIGEIRAERGLAPAE